VLTKADKQLSADRKMLAAYENTLNKELQDIVDRMQDNQHRN
jgi:hypothetical protein